MLGIVPDLSKVACSKCKSHYFKWDLVKSRSICKKCHSEAQKVLVKTNVDSFISQLYNRLKRRTGLISVIGKDEFKSICKESKQFNDLFNKWVKSGNQRKITPAVMVRLSGAYDASSIVFVPACNVKIELKKR